MENYKCVNCGIDLNSYVNSLYFLVYYCGTEKCLATSFYDYTIFNNIIVDYNFSFGLNHIRGSHNHNNVLIYFHPIDTYIIDKYIPINIDNPYQDAKNIFNKFSKLKGFI